MVQLKSFSFSPTGTSAKILKGIVKGISDVTSFPCAHSDLTFVSPDEDRFGGDDIVIVSAPVYGGKISPLVKQRLAGVVGNGARCVVVAVYGNRAFEQALVDMGGFMSDHGFRVCGGGAFIGEHSYSTVDTPIAMGRPDAQDMADALDFGREIGRRILENRLQEVDLTSLHDEPSPAESLTNFRNFVLHYQQRRMEAPVNYLPEVDAELCNDCGSCAEVCPTGAISDDFHAVDAAKCIKCCACVKQCPQLARSLYTPFAEILSANFSVRKSPRWII